MSSKSSIKMMNGLITLFCFAIGLIFTSNTQAQVYGGMYGGIGMQGSGYWGGNQACGFPQMVGTNAISKSDDERDAEDAIKKIQSEMKLAKLTQQRADKELELLRRKIERHFEASVAEFLLDVHIEGSKMCNEYEQSSMTPPPPPPAPAATSGRGAVSAQEVDEDGNPVPTTSSRRTVAASQQSSTVSDPLAVPDLLKGKWSHYCTATSKASAGSVSPSICNDTSLKESGRRGTSNSTTDCARSLASYRKKRMELGKASDKVEDLEAALEDAKFNLQDVKARAKLDRELNKGNTEAGCPDGTCGQAGSGYVFQSNRTNLISGAIQMGGGILASYMGNKNDQAAMEYCAQLGYPTSYCNTGQKYVGLPLVLTGANTMINGGVGQGSFGCGTGASGGYYPYGMGGSSGGMGMYGPYGNTGGAFGYPNGMYGSPWGGGMYNPGMTPWGGFYGPGGGMPGGMNGMYGINGGINGMSGIGMPGMYPGMPGYGMGGMGTFPGIGMGGGLYGGIGGMPGMGGMYGGYPGMYGIGAGGGIGMPGMYPGMPGYGMGGMGTFPGIGMGGGLYGGIGGMPGYGMGGYGGFPGMGGMGGMVGMYPGSMTGNSQYQIQMMQMQQQMMQQQMQYYQAQMQAQMQAYQRQMQVQQQAYQVQQEIASLQMRLQMIYSGAYSGGVSGGAVIGSPYPLTGTNVGYPNGYSTGYSSGVPGTPIGTTGNATFPGVGTGVPSGGR